MRMHIFGYVCIYDVVLLICMSCIVLHFAKSGVTNVDG